MGASRASHSSHLSKNLTAGVGEAGRGFGHGEGIAAVLLRHLAHMTAIAQPRELIGEKRAQQFAIPALFVITQGVMDVISSNSHRAFRNYFSSPEYSKSKTETAAASSLGPGVLRSRRQSPAIRQADKRG